MSERTPDEAACICPRGGSARLKSPRRCCSAAQRFTPALGEVTRRLLDHAADIYARAEPGIPRLPRRCRAAIFAARLIYADIGRVIAARGYDSVSSRAVTSLPRKLWLMVRALFRPVRPSPVTAPPLKEVAFLLTEISPDPISTPPQSTAATDP